MPSLTRCAFGGSAGGSLAGRRPTVGCARRRRTASPSHGRTSAKICCTGRPRASRARSGRRRDGRARPGSPRGCRGPPRGRDVDQPRAPRRRCSPRPRRSSRASCAKSRPRNTSPCGCPKRIGPSASLMPNSVTICRAISVARSMSFCGAGGRVAEDHLLGGAPAEQHRQLVGELAAASRGTCPPSAA